MRQDFVGTETTLAPSCNSRVDAAIVKKLG